MRQGGIVRTWFLHGGTVRGEGLGLLSGCLVLVLAV
jgi:hypothetical protein